VISTFNWQVTIAALLIIIALDFSFAIYRRNQETTLREASLWSLFYVSLAIAFGIYLGQWFTKEGQQEFFAGWLTEYSLSFDNLFVFVLILTRCKIEKERQQLALLL